MLISEELTKAINAQVGREFGASLQYVMLGAYFEREALPQLAAKFYMQADEEKMHALKLAHYVTEAGGVLKIPAVPAGRPDFASAAEAVQLAFDWESAVTKQINDLVGLALAEKDHLAQIFFQWFVTEQLEEMTSMDQLLRTIKRAGDNLLWVEDYLARQGATAPAPAA